MMPFYIYYSMFGFQRIGDLAWAAGDMRARGFLLGGTSGRTTLNGEGLQHEDGHSHILAARSRTASAYDPTFAYEVGGDRAGRPARMYEEQEDVYYYITLMNENYAACRRCRPAPRRDHQGHVPAAGRREGKKEARACNCSAAARSCAKSSPRKSCSRRTGASPPTSGAARASTSCARDGQDASAGTCCIRPTSRVPFVGSSSKAHAGR
jgi:hypothetical protein